MKREDHLLVILAEEAAEIVQDTTKALRFGLDEVYQVTGLSNRDRLINECNDLLAVIEMLQADGTLPKVIVDRIKVEKKKAKVEQYLRYSEELGRLEEKYGDD